MRPPLAGTLLDGRLGAAGEAGLRNIAQAHERARFLHVQHAHDEPGIDAARDIRKEILLLLQTCAHPRVQGWKVNRDCEWRREDEVHDNCNGKTKYMNIAYIAGKNAPFRGVTTKRTD